jgi:YfiH family protein
MDPVSHRETRTATPTPLFAWKDPRLSHGFLGRIGGVSRGPFAELNFSYLIGDDQEAVDENWRRLRELLPGASRIARLHQVHGDMVRTVTASDDGIVGQGDGLVTSDAGVVLCVLSADCVPILMADGEAGVVGALHAGWRGVFADIATAGVRAMTAQGASPSRMRAALGPGIGDCCFEVDEELAQRFRQRFPNAANHVRKGKPGKGFVDLKGILVDRLIAAGLAHDAVISVGPCTRCAADRFFSRRASADGRTGLQLSYIALSGQTPRES